MLGVFAEFERSRNEFVRAWRGQGCGDEAGAPAIPQAKRSRHTCRAKSAGRSVWRHLECPAHQPAGGMTRRRFRPPWSIVDATLRCLSHRA
jgi:hypothetical protein